MINLGQGGLVLIDFDLNYKAIGKRVKIARIKADMTQSTLADVLDISLSHISNIETGTTRVSLSALVCIANALSVTMDDLLYDSVIHARPQLERELQETVNECDDYELRVVKDVAHTVISTLRENEALRQGTPAAIQ